jgi:hypothetical protein
MSRQGSSAYQREEIGGFHGPRERRRETRERNHHSPPVRQQRSERPSETVSAAHLVCPTLWLTTGLDLENPCTKLTPSWIDKDETGVSQSFATPLP